MTNDIWEAFKIARDRLYPKYNHDQKTYTTRKASLYLDERLSRHTLLKELNKGTLRADENGQIYEEDLKLLNLILDLKDSFFKAGVILPVQDLAGKDVYALIPKSVNKLGVGESDQSIKSVAIMMKHKFVQEWLKNLDLSGEVDKL